MLERIALHQTRLRTPGLVLDAKGVALGTRGIVLLPSIDRLVAFLAIYTRERSLEDLAPSLTMRFVRSKLGTREIVFECSAESSDRMDRLAETARLIGGFAFTGTSRHFVQYRDAGAPFGYDTPELYATDAPFALYHSRFSQTYADERPISLRTLLLRLMPRLDRPAPPDSGSCIVVAEPGLGPALVHYLVRSHVKGEAGLVEWPPASAFDEGPVRRWIVRVAELPPRMQPLLRSTPGLRMFLPAAPGAAVEVGFRHPIELAACPVFDAAGLILFRGRGDEPWIVERLPPFGELTAFARVEFYAGTPATTASRAVEPDPVRVPFRVTPSSRPSRAVTATWVPADKLPLLRRLAYALSRTTLAQMEIALGHGGAFLRSSAGIEGFPLGTFFSQVHPLLYVASGYDVLPAVAPEALAHALGVSATHVVFLAGRGAPMAVEQSAFGPLEAALLEAPPWEPWMAQTVASALHEDFIELKVAPTGIGALLPGSSPSRDGRTASPSHDGGAASPSHDGGAASPSHDLGAGSRRKQD